MSSATTASDDISASPASASRPLRLLLAAVGVACLAGFVYGNSHTEAMHLAYPRFAPWLWNLYLTTLLAGVVGVAGLIWSRRWGFWTLAAAGFLSVLIGIYAMGITMVGAMTALTLAAVWRAVQAEWTRLG